MNDSGDVYHYVTTVQQPTVVTDAVCANFIEANCKSLIVAKGISILVFYWFAITVL